MKKWQVGFFGGELENGGSGNFMISYVISGDRIIKLYAEYPGDEVDFDSLDKFDSVSYDFLKKEIIRQAAAFGITPGELSFQLD